MGEIQVRVAQANADTLAAQITSILNNTRSHNTKVGLRGVQIADKTVLATTAWQPPRWGCWPCHSSFLLTVKRPIAAERLTSVIDALLLHHDALRFCYSRNETDWQQVYGEPKAHKPFAVVDLRGTAPAARWRSKAT